MGLIQGLMCILFVCLAEQAEQRELGPGGESEQFAPQGQPEVNVTKMLETMEAMEAKIMNLEFKLSKMESEVAEQNNITTQLNYKESVNRRMAAQSMNLATQSTQKATESMNLATQSMNLATQSNGRISSLEQKEEEFTAFSTYLTSTINPSGGYMIVPFSGIVTNVGGHFSPSSHKFTCPVNGHYFFSYSLYSGDIKEGSDDGTRAWLVKDGTLINQVVCATDTEENIYCQPGNSAVIYCGRGSNVYVETRDSHTKIFGSSYRFTTFSGFLIK